MKFKIRFEKEILKAYRVLLFPFDAPKEGEGKSLLLLTACTSDVVSRGACSDQKTGQLLPWGLAFMIPEFPIQSSKGGMQLTYLLCSDTYKPKQWPDQPGTTQEHWGGMLNMCDSLSLFLSPLSEYLFLGYFKYSVW